MNVKTTTPDKISPRFIWNVKAIWEVMNTKPKKEWNKAQILGGLKRLWAKKDAPYFERPMKPSTLSDLMAWMLHWQEHPLVAGVLMQGKIKSKGKGTGRYLVVDPKDELLAEPPKPQAEKPVTSKQKKLPLSAVDCPFTMGACTQRRCSLWLVRANCCAFTAIGLAAALQWKG